MSDDVVTVGGYEDVLGQDGLSTQDELAIVDALSTADDDQLVVWVPDWLAAENDLEAAGSSDQVFVGSVGHRTKKAILLEQPPVEDWIPKSQAVLFERAPDATLSTPQQTLGGEQA